jgi:hypothetical protein
VNPSLENVVVKYKVSFWDFVFGYAGTLRILLWIIPIYAFSTTALGVYGTLQSENIPTDVVPRAVYFLVLQTLFAVILLPLAFLVMMCILYFPRRNVFASTCELSLYNDVLVDSSSTQRVELNARSIKWTRVFYERLLAGLDNGAILILPPHAEFSVGSRQILSDWLTQAADANKKKR